MVSKLVAASVSVVLAASSIAPGAAFAQEYRFGGFDAPRGLTATVNLRVPLGREAAAARPSYGLTVGYGRELGGDVDGRTHARAVNLADLRFSGPRAELSRASLGAFDLADFDRSRRQMNLVGKKSILVLGIVIGAALVVCLAADCFDGDDTEPAD